MPLDVTGNIIIQKQHDVTGTISNSNAVQWIPFLMFFFFLFEKIESPTCQILFKFSGELCYGFIYSPLYE